LESSVLEREDQNTRCSATVSRLAPRSGYQTDGHAKLVLRARNREVEMRHFYLHDLVMGEARTFGVGAVTGRF
jgi:hypothetical protein